MNLNLETLKQTGAFTGAPVEREITWKQGAEEFTATVFVRPLSYHSAVSDVAALAGERDGMAGRIAACICDEQGKPVFTAEDITDGPVVLGEDGKPLYKDEPVLDQSGEPKLSSSGKPVVNRVPLRTGGALNGNLTMALLTVIAEVSGWGKLQS
ncbi:phage tail assembly chaperone family protein, TAC [Halopseudomonas aestusnigri]|uniref:phage tail assembly chaperone family protein, TAC n=1 Tax=Halopseudomonas aestusnigri TaxID=857252 RepID=UPI0025577D3C|nr:phage tail assembly chaperone family protein, TAC [Halopseudomonas aestusnigri]MDL2200664.1 phage tail assembly chaperone family protein, TAC [Halopseudomonas aestusnigri]